ncbi:protein SPT2 homolog [Adelges cooleyi]|uniref:protein SPT2 homolog n=1 Tax=Adelges cooleyi TaxID=133065 RepID=UPI0021800D7D|nr:protein SPT2 homolog [Adelges cooleyi]XP_050425864.1 protein SPT2 homolog [Adelges cooleyi]
MDQESGSGRRRSSRLAARGVVAPPKPEVVKTPKNEDKPKRSKRKQSDERPSSAAKKLKTEDDEPLSSTPEKEECKTEENKVDTNKDQVDTTAPAKVADVVSVPPSSENKEECVNADAEKTDVVKPQDPKEQDKTLQDEEKTMDVDVPTPPPEEKKDAEELKPVVEVEPVEPQIVKKIEEEPVTDAKVIGNGLSAEKEAKKDVQPEKFEKEIKAVVKESITSNGTVDAELKPSNGTGPKINSDAVETNEAISGNKPHVTDCEYSQKSIATVNNASNETATKEVASTESEKIVDNAVDNNTIVSADSVAPNKDHSSTIQS